VLLMNLWTDNVQTGNMKRIGSI